MNSNFSFCNYFTAFHTTSIPILCSPSSQLDPNTTGTKEIAACISWKSTLETSHIPHCVFCGAFE